MTNQVRNESKSILKTDAVTGLFGTTNELFKSFLMQNKTYSQIKLIDALRLYAQMLHVRVFEERCAILYTSKKIAGFCHLYTGQEAVGIGIQSILEPGDNIISGYRVHGHGIVCRMHAKTWEEYKTKHVKTGDLDEYFSVIQAYLEDKSQAKTILAELTAKQTGCSKGKGGSMHLFDKDYDFYGGTGIVGAQIPNGAGLALADQYMGNPNVTFASLGDGAMNQGQVYETFNMASLWNLPIVFVLENNGYAIGTAQSRASAGGPLHERARPFGIQTALIDGMNITDVIDAAKWAREHALSHGPVLLEMNTYRYRPHSMSDPGTYRTKDEVSMMRETRDPIDYIKRFIVEKFNINEDIFAKFEEVEENRIEEVLEYCEDCTYPGEEELMSDIFVS